MKEKTVTFHIKLTIKERREVEKATKNAGHRSMSSYARWKLLKEPELQYQIS